MALNHFLQEVERRAYRMAAIATGDEDEALDIVQDAMLKLATKYQDKSANDWPPLFHRILQSTIKDWYRRRKVRTGIMRLFGLGEVEQEYGADAYAGNVHEQPEKKHQTSSTVTELDRAVRGLPLRQQQVFLLREMEGLDVKQTAAALEISAGSVKTHYSRAVHSLREQLEGHWP